MSGGKKFDQGKPRIDLLPFEAIEDIAAIMTFGATKYEDHNWAKGMDWGRLFGAAQRHLAAWQRGEETDPESNLPHLAHATCNLIFLLYYAKYNLGNDDRLKRSKK